MFQVGDKVICITPKYGNCHELELNKIYTISKISEVCDSSFELEEEGIRKMFDGFRFKLTRLDIFGELGD